MQYIYGLTDVSTNISTSVAVKSDGTFYVWGDNSTGHLGYTLPSTFYIPPTNLGIINTHIVKACPGGVHILLLSSEGDIYSWGSGYSGRLGNGGEDASTFPEPIPFFKQRNIKIKDIACSGGHNIALSQDGRVYCWGFGSGGRLGSGTNEDQYVPASIRFFDDRNVVKVLTGIDHTMVVCESQ